MAAGVAGAAAGEAAGGGAAHLIEVCGASDAVDARIWPTDARARGPEEVARVRDLVLLRACRLALLARDALAVDVVKVDVTYGCGHLTDQGRARRGGCGGGEVALRDDLRLELRVH